MSSLFHDLPDGSQMQMIGNFLSIASRGDRVGLNEMLRQGMPPNVQDYDLRTALHLAASEGHASIVELLLAYNADVNLRDRWERTETRRRKTELFASDPPRLFVLHYLGNKPWMCFRDYDCNWNVDFLQEFASDVAHNRWLDVHDAMPARLQEFCLLQSKQKAQLERDPRQGEKAGYPDGHWGIGIRDQMEEVH